MTLGQRLKELRLSKNWTLRELAKLVEADFTYLSKIENDRTDRPPSEELLGKLADKLGANRDELMGLSGELPKDVREAVARNKQALAFLRSAVSKDLSPEEWARLKDEIEKRNQGVHGEDHKE
ncbi:helix-turn-helix protein [compost metagenome]|jgi:transcriptional regulator with XRE-family HTH domain